MEEVSVTMSKTGISTGNFVVQVTLTRKGFSNIPNTLMCQERIIPMVVERWCPYCWSCSVMRHMVKACPSKKAASQPNQAAVPAAAVTDKVPDGGWKEVRKKG